MENKKQTYTEKVTLRLTTEDKQQYQKEADNKKLPLTTLLRHKINGDEKDEVIFEPKLIYFDNDEYRTAFGTARKNLKQFEAIKTELTKFLPIPTSKEDLTELLKTPNKYVENAITSKYASKIDIPISFTKLVELLEIDLSKFQQLTKNYRPTYLILDENNNVVTNVNEDNFKHYTTNQAENTRLKQMNEFIECFTNVIGKGHNNYKIHQLQRLMSDVLIYDSHLNTLRPRLSYIKK
ncbi:hypothetical protein [Winogradskyella vidalii]|uniref:hypothetical protein n=1 Tax=Winogradskyella vidalii TaxID=2615024 RepID=UPI0015CBC9FE|nr:hypothetical protein [Winogradskyella vidalii]